MASWDAVYRKDKVDTAKSVGTCVERRATKWKGAIAATVGAPDVVRSVFIMTSSLSRADVEAAFARIAAGQLVRQQCVQLYWILMGFFSACAEIGAVGYVIC